MSYLSQIRELIAKKADELLSTESLCYDDIYARLTMFILDNIIDFLSLANEEALTIDDVCLVSSFLNDFACSLSAIKAYENWFKRESEAMPT